MDLSGNIVPALILTTLAGLSTGIGGAIAYFIKKPKMIYLSLSLGFSAGVMIYISFMELLPRSIEETGNLWGEEIGKLLGTIVFFAGIIVIAVIDMLIPAIKNPHHLKDFSDFNGAQANKIIMRTGIFTALAIAIHNFPEGLATLGASLANLKLGAVIALAVAIHNIPEGISVSVPIFYATKDKKKAFIYSFLSGLAEPAGAIIGILILLPFLSAGVLSSLMAFAAGIMIYISMDELLPMAHRYGHSHTVIAGIVLGMLVMAVSFLIL